MRTGDWARDRRPVRRVAADEAAPAQSRDWPASIPAVAQVLRDGLELPAGVTLLVGENGSGKSTLVEAVAMAFGLAAEGGTRNVHEGTRATESPLHPVGDRGRLARPGPRLSSAHRVGDLAARLSRPRTTGNTLTALTVMP